LGVAVIVRVPMSMLETDTLETSSLEDDSKAVPITAAEEVGASKTLVLEVLPHSGLVWTEDGKPSDWRKMPRT
jgi:hypothetical protein